ncbi:hypothetical protein [Pseudothioclava arenosa]|uniref:Colicin transporter n=1 Tax=Pseudothioclava arenosa TaxID=1795308 RepID=A0A2A4CU65_9RHOB|nr:hypothetical protein [Pseudothioclava arenosa]PCD77689.1 hypothetical protein CLN94_04105 [Pseudothioclava arenosa]
MSEIAEFERRISFALERVERGFEAAMARAEAIRAAEAADFAAAAAQVEAALAETQEMGQSAAPVVAPAEAPVTTPDPAQEAELAQLREALDAERMANAQLSERVRAIREKQENTLSALEKRLAATTRALEALKAEASRLKRANADLAAANQSLVAAGPEGAGALVNRAMQAELESLRAARGAEAAELADLISALEPVLDEAEARSKTETKDA